MSFSFFSQGFIPEDSYSRQLDMRVASDEYPYGYNFGEPPEGHRNIGFNDEHFVSPSLSLEKKKMEFK